MLLTDREFLLPCDIPSNGPIIWFVFLNCCKMCVQTWTLGWICDDKRNKEKLTANEVCSVWRKSSLDLKLEVFWLLTGIWWWASYMMKYFHFLYTLIFLSVLFWFSFLCFVWKRCVIFENLAKRLHTNADQLTCTVLNDKLHMHCVAN